MKKEMKMKRKKRRMFEFARPNRCKPHIFAPETFLICTIDYFDDICNWNIIPTSYNGSFPAACYHD